MQPIHPLLPWLHTPVAEDIWVHPPLRCGISYTYKHSGILLKNSLTHCMYLFLHLSHNSYVLMYVHKYTPPPQHGADSLGEDSLSEDLDRLRASLQAERDDHLSQTGRLAPTDK